MADVSSKAVNTADEMSDEELVDAFNATGDRAAVEKLINRYSPRLRRLVITLVGTDEAMLMDAEQEVFITLVRRLVQFRGHSRFSTFFYRVARNRVLDLIRSGDRYRRRIARLPEPEQTAGQAKDPQQLLVESERITQVRAAMDQLNPQDRLLLYLKDGEDQPIADLSELTGMPEGTIKSRLARSRVKVARALEDPGYEH